MGVVVAGGHFLGRRRGEREDLTRDPQLPKAPAAGDLAGALDLSLLSAAPRACTAR